MGGVDEHRFSSAYATKNVIVPKNIPRTIGKRPGPLSFRKLVKILGYALLLFLCHGKSIP
jgi:hypothetical protein